MPKLIEYPLQNTYDDGVQLIAIIPGVNEEFATLRVPKSALTNYVNSLISAAGGGPAGADGREIELSNNGTYILWRYQGDATWDQLIALADLKGVDGTDGESAYQTAVANGFVGTETQWLASLKGAKGDPGNAANIAADTHAATAKTTPVDADEIGLIDSAASWALKKLTFANLKAWIGSLFVSRTSAQVDGNLNIIGNIRINNSTPNAKLQLDNAIDANGYDVGKIRFYESGSAICGIGVSSGQVNYRAADDHVMYSGTTEAARINHIDALTLKGRLRVGQIATFNSLPNDTDWLRLCTFPAGNQPRYVRFTLGSSEHDHWLVEFSPGAGGDRIRAKVALLGSFNYYSAYPLQWRICTEGVNSSCHIDIKFGGRTLTSGYTLTVLENYSSTGTSFMAYFPCTNVGASVNGGAGESYGIQLGTTSGITYREAELIPGYYARIGADLARTNGTIAVNAVVV